MAKQTARSDIPYALRLQELIALFYEDREVQEVHLDERLKSMGFDIRDGRVFAIEDGEGNIVKRGVKSDEQGGL